MHTSQEDGGGHWGMWLQARDAWSPRVGEGSKDPAWSLGREALCTAGPPKLASRMRKG